MLVFDRNIFGSKREVDSNGYLRVEICNITKTQVAPYLGREIPNYEDFGIDANTVYNVLRPEDELIKAIPTFNNLPLTRKHIEVDVDNVPKDEIVGSLGDRAEYDRPYLKNSLIVYDKKEIDKIMSGKKKELSCGYRYTPVRENGVFDGKPYDFKMTDIVGNHIALVKEGRAGHDVVVSDTIEFVKEKIMGLFGKKEIVNDEFKEEDHPRAENGQFKSAGGSESKNPDNLDFTSKDVMEFAKSLPEQGISRKDAEKLSDRELAMFIAGLTRANAGRSWADSIENAQLWLNDHDKKEIMETWFKKDPEGDMTDMIRSAIVGDKAIPEKQEDPKKAGEEKALKDGEKEMAEKEEVKETSEKKVEEKKPAEKEVVEDKEAVEEVKEEVVEEKCDHPEEETEKKKSEKKEDLKEEKVEDKCAMDSAMAMDIDAIKAQVRQEVIEDFKARDIARKSVRSVVGDLDVMAFDSADDIYKFACEKAGMNLNEIASYKDAYAGYIHGKGTRLALDASPKSGSNEECFTGIRLD